MSSDQQDIQELHSTWIQAVNAGDLPLLLTLVTDDVVLLSPGQTPAGRDGFSAAFSNAYQQMRFRCSSELEEVVVVGDVAYTRSRDALSIGPRTGDETTQFSGYRLTIYRRQPGGQWLLARDAHTLTPS